MGNLKKFGFYRSKVQKFYPMPVSKPAKKELNFFYIWFLKKLKTLVEWMIEIREKNKQINRKILIELNLPEDSDIKNLGSYHKKEFQRLKYIFYSKNVKAKNFKEPAKIYLPESSISSFSNKSEESVIELFKSMENKEDSDEFF